MGLHGEERNGISEDNPAIRILYGDLDSSPAVDTSRHEVAAT
jgi:hypothetical protein